MISKSMPLAYPQAVRAFFPTEEVSCVRIDGGGNNHIYRIESKRGRYCLKQYVEDDEKRMRQETERKALTFLSQCGLDSVPRYYGKYQTSSLYSWIDGASPDSPTDGDVERAAEFVQTLQACSAIDGAGGISTAYQACTSLDGLLVQLHTRCERLKHNLQCDVELLTFVQDRLCKSLELAQKLAVAGYEQYGWSRGPIARKDRRVIHGDFGLHNCLRGHDGGLSVIDFEYFGWDDPVKMVADFLLHPGRPLNATLRAEFMNALGRKGFSDSAAARLQVLLPSYAVRWACISLDRCVSDRSMKKVQMQVAADLLEGVLSAQ
jgi:aminoglycoside phosphotransferase (APT) family kinase protein